MRHPDYGPYNAMMSRCYNQKRKNFPYYGGRGIAVCDRWRGSFKNFIADMGPRPSPKHQLDRVDTNGDYAPGNCRWVLPITQQRNRRRHLRLTLNGLTLTCAEWAERIGIDKDTLRKRVAKYGLSDAEALTRPIGAHRFKDTSSLPARR